MNHRTPRLITAGTAGIAAAALFLSGCTSSSSDPGNSTSSAGPSKDVVIAYDAIDNVDTIQFKTNADYMVTNNVYGTLVKENYAEKNGILVGNDTYSPELAESVAWDAAGTTFTVKLKPDLKFADGAPLTSADVVYTIQRSLSDASYATAFKQYIGVADAAASVKALDDLTVTIGTQFKAPLLEKFLSFPVFGILQKAAAEKNKTADDPWAKTFFAKNVIASGPYMVDSWPGDDSMVLRKNPNFTAADLTDSPQTVTVQNIPDPNQKYLALQQGQIDIALGLAPKLAKQAQSDPKVKVTTSPASNLVYLGWNNTDPVLKDPKVRQALSYLVPYQTLRSEVAAGFANAAYGPAPFPMQSALDTDGTKDAYPTDAAKAKALLAEAGQSNLSITLSVNAGDPTSIETATFLQSAFAGAGVNLKVDQLQAADYNTKLGERQLQAFLGEWYSWGEDAIYQMFFLLNSGSFVNYTGYDNSRLDQLVTQGVSESVVTKRNEISQQAQRIAIDDVPMTYLYTRNFLAVSNPNVSGITQPDDLFPYFRYLSVQ